ncbi:unnamed protein product [Meganyctiphanes norvegica]|uniref:Uncharacterized protein n=1 Tax=Meganyctiphanes norvegica TaxID=48144 RepID=A0AAV2RD50_MEGNR
MAGQRQSPTAHSAAHQKLHKGTSHPRPTESQMTPVRPNKRRHQNTVSPNTTQRNETTSPRAKQRPSSAAMRQSPPTVTNAPPANATAVPVQRLVSNSRSRTVSRSSSVSPSGQLAVPRVSAEPPCPSALPKPPTHWMVAGPQQSCRVVTESLLSHLTSSGILVSA